MIGAVTISLLLTLVLSLFLTPAAKWVGKKVGAIDIPNNRKVHSSPTTRMGGLSIVLSFVIVLIAYALYWPQAFSHIVSDTGEAILNTYQALIIACSLIMVFAVGVWDDIKTLGPGLKFLIQFIAASLIYFAGFEISLVSGEPLATFGWLHWLSYPLTVLWIVGITNAFNLIDGLDGLAAGVAVIALGTIAAISLVYGQAGITLVAALLAGSILGFLWYNFRPATIFLGDSGSLFLGFVLALLSIQSYTRVSTAFAILVPIFALGLPIIDTLLSMVRRFFAWFLPGKDEKRAKVSFTHALGSIFLPDKSHIHHRLISRGLSHRNTVLVLYLFSILFGIGAFLVAQSQQVNTTILIILLLTVIIKMGVSRLKYDEIDLLHNGIFFAVYNYLFLNKRHFRKIIDGLFVVVAFLLSSYMLQPEETAELLKSRQESMILLGSVFTINLSAYWLSGLYKETIRRLGIADVFKILKAVLIGVAVTATAHYLLLDPYLPFNYLIYILGFYFVGSLILGVRVSFHILRYLFHKSRASNKRVLIYGAGERGLLALHRMLNLSPHLYTPVGFIDEDPKMEGRLINGFPVFGGHWKLERLIQTRNIDELHLAEVDAPPEVMKRIQKIASKYDLGLRELHVQLKSLSTRSTNKISNIEQREYVK